MANKFSRNKIKCKTYLIENRRVVNKQKKLLRHLIIHPNDAQASKTLKTLSSK